MYKPKMRVNVAEGAYVVILNWAFSVSGWKDGTAGYVGNKGTGLEFQVPSFKFRVSSFFEIKVSWLQGFGFQV
jgi:hypothetical protein